MDGFEIASIPFRALQRELSRAHPTSSRVLGSPDPRVVPTITDVAAGRDRNW